MSRSNFCTVNRSAFCGWMADIILACISCALQFSWYMDRAAISALYTSTELFWISDKSPGQIDTWHFLESNVERAEGLRSGAAGAFNSVMSAVDLSSATLSTIVRSVRGRY